MSFRIHNCRVDTITDRDVKNIQVANWGQILAWFSTPVWPPRPGATSDGKKKPSPSVDSVEQYVGVKERELLLALDVRVRVPGLPLCALVALSVPVEASFPPELPDDFPLGLFGPRTLPSLAYSQTRPRVTHRSHVGCSPLHYVMVRNHLSCSFMGRDRAL